MFAICCLTNCSIPARGLEEVDGGLEVADTAAGIDGAGERPGVAADDGNGGILGYGVF